mgnify:CR=1 FL=1
MQKELSVVIIPTYNEKENIEKMVRKVFSLSEPFHILVVDDGSPDGTAAIVKTLMAEFPERLHILERQSKDGLGRAYKAGFNWALGQGYDSGIMVKDWPLGRILISYGASFYVRSILWMKVYDSTAGFVCYRSKVLKTIDLDKVRMKGYGFQIEMKYNAWRLGFKIQEVPITFTDRKEGVSKMSGSIFGEAFRGVIALRFRKSRGRQ